MRVQSTRRMKSHQHLLVIAILTMVVVFGTVGTAFASTITVQLKANGRAPVAARRLPAWVTVQGTGNVKSFWQTQSVDGQNLGLGGARDKQVPPFTVLNTVPATYKVTVFWHSAYGQQGGWTPAKTVRIGWWAWEQNPTVEFVSP